MGMFGARKLRGENFLDQYPPRWWCPIVNIYGGAGHEEVYMRRFILSPKLPRGQLYLHVFFRPDQDRDPHDHPFPFWTLPLNQGYIEEVYNSRKHCFSAIFVPPLKWSHRAAKHTHRITATQTGHFPLVTLVWRGNTERTWGFWCHTQGIIGRVRDWVRWQDYVVNKDGVANVDGTDEQCPGFARGGLVKK